jgi:hypothetical protein
MHEGTVAFQKTDELDFSKLTDEELQAFELILEKYINRSGEVPEEQAGSKTTPYKQGQKVGRKMSKDTSSGGACWPQNRFKPACKAMTHGGKKRRPEAAKRSVKTEDNPFEDTLRLFFYSFGSGICSSRMMSFSDSRTRRQ